MLVGGRWGPLPIDDLPPGREDGGIKDAPPSVTPAVGQALTQELTMSATRLRPIVRPLAVAALAAFALAGCGMLGPGSVPADDVETQISDKLEAQVGQAPDEVSCPEDLPAEEGSEITCVLVADDQSIDVTVTVSTVEDDTVNFDIQVADEAN